MKSITKETQVNQNKVVTVIGQNKVSKDLLDLVVYDDGGNQYTISELFDTVLSLKQQLKTLKNTVSNYEKSEDNVDKTITEALDLLSLKMSQVEMSIKELEDKTKLL